MPNNYKSACNQNKLMPSPKEDAKSLGGIYLLFSLRYHNLNAILKST